MKYAKSLFFLLTFMAVISCKNAIAQAGKDTTFSFYFDTNKHTTGAAQQKGFKTFLHKVQRIKTVSGYTDTTGTWAHNKVLALQRAYHVYNLLPKALLTNVEVIGEVETNAHPQLWQNRRVDVVATLLQNPMPANTQTLLPETRVNDTTAELAIEPILFIPDQPVLTEQSDAYMQILARQLQQYTGAHFQIVGHVNYQSKLPPERLKDLYELSEKRAKAVYDRLAQNGIDAQRMTYKGVGNSQPVIASPANNDEKRKNMRVQVFVIRR